jgi:guanylate kinase
MKNLFVVLSGPSGSGKTTLATRLLATYSDLKRIVTCTTRSPRPDEIDGRDYTFLSPEEFRNRVESGQFLEHSEVYGHRYGTPNSELYRHDRSDLLLTTDVRGAETVVRLFEGWGLPHHLTSVFVAPRSREEAADRLTKRGSETQAAVNTRLDLWVDEIKKASIFQYIIGSTTYEKDWYCLSRIYRLEKGLILGDGSA